MGLGSCVIVRTPMCVARQTVRVRASQHIIPSNCFSSSSSAQTAHSSLTAPAALHRLPVFCSKRTSNEDDQLSPEEEADKDNGHDDITDHQQQTYISSVTTVAFWLCTALAFGVGVGYKEGVGKATEFFAGYILEQSLSVDNLFVFVLIFKYFKVPIMYQNRVLSYGIAGAVFFRLTLILLGTATLQRFEGVNLLLAAILLYSSFKLFASEEDESDLSNNFVVKTCQRFIPVTTYYDGNRFITNQDGVWKGSNILGRPHLCFLL